MHYDQLVGLYARTSSFPALSVLQESCSVSLYLMSKAKRSRLMRLTAEVLCLRLMQANLVATGSKQAMVQQLLDHAEDNITSDQEEQSNPATPVGQSDPEQDHECRVPARRSSLSSRSSSSTPQRGGFRSLHRPRAIVASSSPSGSVASRSPVPDADRYTGRRKAVATAAPVLRLDRVQRCHRRRSRSRPTQADAARSPSSRSRAPPKRRSRRSSSQEGHRPRTRRENRAKLDSSTSSSFSSSSSSSSHDREAVVTGGTIAAAVLAVWRNSLCPCCPPARLLRPNTS